MLVEAVIATAAVMAAIIWLLARCGIGTGTQRRGERVEELLRDLAPRLRGEVTSGWAGGLEQPILRLEIDGTPAAIRLSPGRDHPTTELTVDLACLRRSAVDLPRFIEWWQSEAPPHRIAGWLANGSIPEEALERLLRLRQHRYARRPLTATATELRISVGRIATAARIIGCIDLARQLTELTIELAAPVSGRGSCPYR